MPPRRQLIVVPSMKFTIRDLLLLTVIVALAVGWWIDRNLLLAASQRLQQQSVAALRERDCAVADQRHACRMCELLRKRQALETPSHPSAPAPKSRSE